MSALLPHCIWMETRQKRIFHFSKACGILIPFQHRHWEKEYRFSSLFASYVWITDLSG
jgi:hypothetical protein